LERIDDVYSTLEWLKNERLLAHNQKPYSNDYMGGRLAGRFDLLNELIDMIENNVPNQRPHLGERNGRI
jgi:hypothetical protein